MTLNFKDCTLVKLDETFGLKQIKTSPTLDSWLTGQADTSDLEQQILVRLRDRLIANVHDWNEAELIYNFIGPVITFVDYTTDQFNFFAQREVAGVVDGIEMSGKPDGMIASGYREPKNPYFCFQEYKKEKDPHGDPAGQALAAMLVAQAISKQEYPIYGCYIMGRNWFFMTLQDREYCISNEYVATRDDVFDIFRILNVLKEIIATLINKA